MASFCGTGGWAGPLAGDPDDSMVLTANSALGGIDLLWTYPGINPHTVAFYEIWRNTEDNLFTAINVGKESSDSYFDPVPAGVLHFYWIRAVSIHGTYGNFVGPAFALGKPFAEELLRELNQSISEDFLDNDLRTKIAEIGNVEQLLRQEIQDRTISETQIAATLSDVNAAAVQSLAVANQVLDLQSSDNAALVQSINTVQTQVNDNTASVQTQAQSIDGLKAQYTVKVDVNGHVSGFGLASTSNGAESATSKFIVNADQFGVGSPGKADQFPFVIDTSTNSVGINGQLVVNGEAIIDKLAASSIHGSKIVAGSLSADTFTSGTGGGNLLPNAAFAATYTGLDGKLKPDGLSALNGYLQSPANAVLAMSVSIAGNDDLHPPGVDGFIIWEPAQQAYGDDAYLQTVGEMMPAVAEQYYELSCYIGYSGASAGLYLFFYNSSGNEIGYISAAEKSLVSGKSGGKSLSDFDRKFSVGQAPVGTVSMRIAYRKFCAITTNTATLVEFLMPYVGIANGPNQSQPSPWSPSGVGTQMHGGVLKTSTVTADKFAVNSLSAITGNMGYLTAGEIHGGKIHGGGYSAYAWPPAGQNGFYLGPEGLMIGNYNDGQYVQFTQDGNMYAPGMSIDNGNLTISQLNCIGTHNILEGALTQTFNGSATNNIDLWINNDSNRTATVLVIAMVGGFTGYVWVYGDENDYTLPDHSIKCLNNNSTSSGPLDRGSNSGSGFGVYGRPFVHITTYSVSPGASFVYLRRTGPNVSLNVTAMVFKA